MTIVITAYLEMVKYFWFRSIFIKFLRGNILAYLRKTLRQYRTEIVRILRSQIFRQIVQI